MALEQCLLYLETITGVCFGGLNIFRELSDDGSALPTATVEISVNVQHYDNEFGELVKCSNISSRS